jgi:hypothetical protein
VHFENSKLCSVLITDPAHQDCLLNTLMSGVSPLGLSITKNYYGLRILVCKSNLRAGPHLLFNRDIALEAYNLQKMMLNEKVGSIHSIVA